MLTYLCVFGVAFGVSVALVATQHWHGRSRLAAGPTERMSRPPPDAFWRAARPVRLVWSRT